MTLASIMSAPVLALEREVNLVTLRSRPHSPAVAALVHEATRIDWKGDPMPPADTPPDAAVVIGRATHFGAASGL